MTGPPKGKESMTELADGQGAMTMSGKGQEFMALSAQGQGTQSGPEESLEQQGQSTGPGQEEHTRDGAEHLRRDWRSGQVGVVTRSTLKLCHVPERSQVSTVLLTLLVLQ